MGVLFAAGAVSGTMLSFEMGILWPGLMAPFGEVFGFPFVLEGFAFFIEAIFVGIYLFGWDRMSPRAHMLSALPIIARRRRGRVLRRRRERLDEQPRRLRGWRTGAWSDADPVGGDVRPVDAGRSSCTCCSPPTW